MKKKLKINRIIILGILAYFLYVIITQQQTMANYREEAAVTEKQKEIEIEKNHELQEKRDNLNSTEYIENVAREKLGMYLPNERVYIDITK